MKVLFIQKEPFATVAIQLILRREGYEVFFCKDEHLVERQLEELDPALVVTDLASSSNLKLVEKIKSNDQSRPVIVLADEGREEILQQAFELGADDYMVQPFIFRELAVRANILTRWKQKCAA